MGGGLEEGVDVSGGEIQDLRFWSLWFVLWEVGVRVQAGNAVRLLVPLGALFEVFVEHGCRSCRRK